MQTVLLLLCVALGLGLAGALAVLTSRQKQVTEALTEMMRVTHTLKGAAGTVGLHAMVDLAHRLESAFAGIDRGTVPWTERTADEIISQIDASLWHRLALTQGLESLDAAAGGDFAALDDESTVQALVRFAIRAELDRRRRRSQSRSEH